MIKGEIEIFQDQVKRWADSNFGDVPGWQPLMGVVEEVGELAHAHLKMVQNIRQGSEKYRADALDAVGDLVVYLAHYCAAMDISLHDAIFTTWESVRKRDWKKYPKTGVPPAVGETQAESMLQQKFDKPWR